MKSADIEFYVMVGSVIAFLVGLGELVGSFFSISIRWLPHLSWWDLVWVGVIIYAIMSFLAIILSGVPPTDDDLKERKAPTEELKAEKTNDGKAEMQAGAESSAVNY